MKLIYQADIGLQGCILIGDPAETIETMAETFDYWAHHLEYHINYATLQVLPGSEIFMNGVQNGRIKDPIAAFSDPDYPINLTGMRDELFTDIHNRIVFYATTLLHAGTTEAFYLDETPHPTLGQGMTCQWRCPKCRSVNIYSNLYHNGWKMRVTCRNCQARTNVTMWNRPMPPHPEADQQLAHAERLDEMFQRTQNLPIRKATLAAYQTLIEEHCQETMDAENVENHEPWSCIRAYLRVGTLLLEEGQQEAALPFLMRAVTKDIWNPACHAAFAKAMLLEESLGAALLYYEKAIEFSKHPPSSWIQQRDELKIHIEENNLRKDKASLYLKPFKKRSMEALTQQNISPVAGASTPYTEACSPQ
ncbi:MAG: hypothetical protein HQL53_10975 [Magnetococcales bacterium]|nr:hypothetical protein [Magnetococcales bacterium]